MPTQQQIEANRQNAKLGGIKTDEGKKRLAIGSLNALEAIKELKERARKGEKINLQEIQKRHGYSEKSAKSMDIKRTKAWKEQIPPFVKQLMSERKAALAEMKKKRGKAKYRDLTNAIDKLTKNIQLLSGKATERHTFSLSELFNAAKD